MILLQKIDAPRETAQEEFITITKIFFKSGDRVNKGDTLLEYETSKAVNVIEADCDGFVKYFCKAEEDIATGNTLIEIYDSFDKEIEANKPSPETENQEEDFDNITFSKSALELIEKENIDKSLFKGFDFVSLEDVKRILEKNI